MKGAFSKEPLLHYRDISALLDAERNLISTSVEKTWDKGGEQEPGNESYNNASGKTEPHCESPTRIRHQLTS